MTNQAKVRLALTMVMLSLSGVNVSFAPSDMPVNFFVEEDSEKKSTLQIRKIGDVSQASITSAARILKRNMSKEAYSLFCDIGKLTISKSNNLNDYINKKYGIEPKQGMKVEGAGTVIMISEAQIDSVLPVIATEFNKYYLSTKVS